MKGSITIAGSLAQKPKQGGHTWVLLQYLLGFRRLGWNVTFIDALTADMCFDNRGHPCSLEDSVNWAALERIMSQFGLQDDYSLIFEGGEKFIGLSRGQVIERVKDSAFLLNIMGFLDNDEILGQAVRRVFLDIDPGFGQMWTQLGLVNMFDGYDAHVTIGEHIGDSECEIPTCNISWITTPQPVVLEHWPAHYEEGSLPYTSIISWRGAYGPISYKGRSYGLRAHEFRKFMDLPIKTDQSFQLALNIHPNDLSDLTALKNKRWEVVDPLVVAADPFSYRSFIQDSFAELMIAKNMYVDTRSGWFSDRSICYLASAKPVLAQDTGLDTLYPVGQGLLIYRTFDELLNGVEEIRSDHLLHARAARAIAEDYFDSDKVLSKLLQKLSVN